MPKGGKRWQNKNAVTAMPATRLWGRAAFTENQRARSEVPLNNKLDVWCWSDQAYLSNSLYMDQQRYKV